jgi:hypothetical protein
MNLYLISQTVNTNYEVFESAIVAAHSEDEARSIHPNGDLYWNGKPDKFNNTWCTKEDVIVKLIGTAADNIMIGVICSNFN